MNPGLMNTDNLLDVQHCRPGYLVDDVRPICYQFPEIVSGVNSIP